VASAPADRPFAATLAARFPARAEHFQGDFSALCERLAAAEALFTMDGGMVHVASYYGVPTTAVFTSGRARKWAPLAAGSATVRRADLDCQPCTLFGQTPPCPRGHACKLGLERTPAEAA
jgi:ADP-heptose:LPS heptosyltransferase